MRDAARLADLFEWQQTPCISTCSVLSQCCLQRASHPEQMGATLKLRAAGLGQIVSVDCTPQLCAAKSAVEILRVEARTRYRLGFPVILEQKVPESNGHGSSSENLFLSSLATCNCTNGHRSSGGCSASAASRPLEPAIYSTHPCCILLSLCGLSTTRFCPSNAETVNLPVSVHFRCNAPPPVPDYAKSPSRITMGE